MTCNSGDPGDPAVTGYDIRWKEGRHTGGSVRQ